MRLIAAAILTLFAASFVNADDTTTEEPWQTSMKDVAIPMRDGKSLAANVLLPDKRGKYPCVLVQTPYNKDRMGREYGDDSKAGEAGRGSEKAWSLFDREHYAYVFVDWRGFYGSKDAMQGVNKRQWKRGQDGYDCVEWIASQTWCDGKVGTWGGSALGKQQFDTLAEQPPHLVCAAPLIAYQGSRYESYYEGGVLLESHVKSLDRLGFGVSKFVTDNPLPGTRLWKLARTLSYHPEKTQVPCLMISGWWDNYPRDVVEQYADIIAKGSGKAKESKLVMGPWSHTAIDMPEQGDLKYGEAESYSTKITIKFFDYYLRGLEDSGWKEVPSVSAFQCGDNKWVSGDSWEKLCGQATSMYLTPDGKVSADKPGAAGDEQPMTRQYKYDPKNPTPTIGGQNLPPMTHGPKDVSKISKRDDVLVYTTDKLAEPLAVRGEVELKLYFKCNRVDTDIHIRLCDEAADGKQYLVSETIQRAKLRDGESVQALKPGETCSVTLRLAPHAYTWVKDHKLVLVLTGGNAPRYEPNTGDGSDHFDKAKALDVDVTIFHDADHPAELKLPIVK
ncbi:MAG: CocE/NonD family hydrolase [Planctomycetes bacterium]|nr:CocE/NonD family hydrolase [Planctomycetota bacterium]